LANRLTSSELPVKAILSPEEPKKPEEVNIPESIKDIYSSKNLDEAIDKIENKYEGFNIKNIGAI